MTFQQHAWSRGNPHSLALFGKAELRMRTRLNTASVQHRSLPAGTQAQALFPTPQTPNFRNVSGVAVFFWMRVQLAELGKRLTVVKKLVCAIEPMWLVTQDHDGCSAENFFRYPTLLLSLDSVLITLNGRSLSLTFLQCPFSSLSQCFW